MKSTGYFFQLLSARLISNLRFVGAPVLIGLLGLWLVPEKIGHSSSYPTGPPAAPSANQPMPTLHGQEALDHLKLQGAYDSLQEAMAAARYEAQWQSTPKLQDLGAAYELKNSANHLLAYVNADGLQVTSLNDDQAKPWSLGLKLVAFGYGEALSAIQAGEVKAEGNRVSIQKSAIRNPQSAIEEWFINASRGIEHGFTINAPPQSAIDNPQSAMEALRLRLAVTGDLTASVNGTGAAFSRTTGNVLLNYNKLFAVDAKGRALEARMKLEGGGLVIEIEDAGAEYPLTIDPLLAFQQQLTADDGAAGDSFGSAVAISGDTVVVGAVGDDGSKGSGYVFTRSGTAWNFQQKLTSSDGAAFDEFGYAVAISGDSVVVGAPFDDSNQGSAYLFVRSGTSWTQQSKLIASDRAILDIFGRAVAISGDTVVVGAHGDTVGANGFQGSAYVFTRSGTTWTQHAKLTASDGAASDSFGWSVAIGGDTIVVGANLDDVGAPDQGSAYVFTRSGTSWTQQARLTASDGTAGDNFGISVAISGDTAVVGAYLGAANGNSQGSAYVFVRSGTSWLQQAKLAASDGADGDRFGIAVAISGETVVVGAFFDSTSPGGDQGSAYVFVRSGTTWAQQQPKLIANDRDDNDHFGNAVAISGDTVVVGANQHGVLVGPNFHSHQGAVYVFVCTWSEQFHALPNDGAANDQFGNSVAISGDRVVVGAANQNVLSNEQQGSAYIFVRSGITWTQEQKLTASDGAEFDQFGVSVAISGDTAVVGAGQAGSGGGGSAYVFVRNGASWTQQQKLSASDGASGDQFGFSVAITGDTIICGAVTDTVGGHASQGSAYVFVRSVTTWSQQQKLIASDGLASDFFGYSVGISGDTVIVGAPKDDSAVTDQGSAYVFVRAGSTWTEQQHLFANDPGSGDQFGFSVAISGDTVVAGAVHDLITFQDQGSAYIFVRSGTSWSLQQKIVASDGQFFDQLGVAVAINGDTVVLGAQADDETQTDQGSAYVYVRSGTSWSFRQKLVASDAGMTDLFGFAVAISGDTIVVGAYRDDVAAADQGSAYVFFMGCNTAPVIVVGGGLARQQGSPASTSTIANVMDSEDPIGYLTVSVASAPDGVSVTNIVNTNGVITASISASCFAPLGNNIVMLRVQDSDGAVASVQLLINVSANSLPVLGSYADTSVAVTTSTTVIPTGAPPSDNGSIVQFTASSPTFAGTLGAVRSSGNITVANARPAGTHVVTVTAVDNCGDTISTGFFLTVTCQSITVNPSTIPGGTAGSAYSQVFTQTGGIAPVTFSLTGTLPTGMSFTPGTATLSGTPTQVGNFPITVTATDVNLCSGSRNYTLSVGAMSLVWNGAISPDWHNAANWTPNAVPTTFTDVLIPTAGVTNQPTISAASSAINAMTIQASRVLTINSSFQLSTAANITTAGTIAGAGKLSFSGLTFTQDGIVSISSVEFGAGTHSLTGGGAFASGIVTVLNAANVSLTSNHSLSVLVINGGGSFDCTNRTLTLTGAGTAIFNSGTFTATGSTIIYQGSVAQVVTANIAYNNLTINNPAGVSLAGDSIANGVLNLVTDLTTGASTLTMPASGSSIGSGDVIGNTKRTGFTNGAPLSFGNPLNTIRFDSGTPPTDVTVNLVKSTPSGFPFNTVSRTYTITPNGGAGFSATLRLRYKDSELNGLTESTLELWRFNGSAWQSPAGAATRDNTQNWVEETGISAFSPWAIAGPSGPTLVELISFLATLYDSGTLLEWRTGLETDNLGFNVYQEHSGHRSPVNTQLIAGSALTLGASLQSGQNYAWWDKEIADCGLRIADCKNDAYWLEDVDLKGESTWHGPFYPSAKGGAPPARSNAALLSEIGNRASVSSDSHSIEAIASVTPPSKLQQIIQAKLVAQSSVKLSINREGWYRVSQRELASVGFDTRVDPRLLQLFVDGRELPIFVRGEQDGFFDPDDSVEFYGVGLDSPFTDSRTYWLTTGSQAGSRIPVDKSNAAPAGDTSFTQTVERRERSIYFSALRNGDRENFFGSVVAANPVDQQLNLTHVAQTDVGTATLEVALQGVTFSPHRVSVELNGMPAGEISFAAQSQSVAAFSVPHSLLREGSNTVRLVAIGGTADISLVDYVRIAYQHTFLADNDSLKLTAPGNHSLTIGGFTSKSIRVFDVTDSSAPRKLSGEVSQSDSGYSVTFASPEPGNRALLAVTAELSPARVSLDQPSSLRSNPADLIIITRREFTESLNPLVALRQSQGLSVTIADIQDIYDEFSFGQKSPFAVRDYLQFAASNWKKPPRFVLFAGDASYDPKNYLGFGDLDLVSTKLVDTDYMETASDDWFADFDYDGVADLAIGRLPVRSPEEAGLLVSKIISYEASVPSREILLASDENDGYDFEASSSRLAALVPTTNTVTQVNRGRVGTEAAKKNLLDGIYRGQKLVNYVGHGSVDQWRAGLLTTADALALRNQRLPVFILMTCLNGFFNEPASDSLAESLIRAEQGGAVAVWASSGLTSPNEQAVMNQEFYKLVFSVKGGPALGDAARRAKLAVGSPDVRRTWVLIGDPSMKLK